MNAPTRRAAFGVLAGVPALSLPAIAAVFADPVYAAMDRHRQAYDTLMDAWAQTRGGLDLEDEADKRKWYDVGTAEEDTFKALLTIRPTTKAGAIACVEHVADIGLVTDELGAWLVMLLGSPLVA